MSNKSQFYSLKLALVTTSDTNHKHRQKHKSQ